MLKLFRLEIADRLAKKIRRYIGQKVLLGIRPKHLQIRTEERLAFTNFR